MSKIITIVLWIITLIILTSILRYQYYPFSGDNTLIIKIDRLKDTVEIIHADFENSDS